MILFRTVQNCEYKLFNNNLKSFLCWSKIKMSASKIGDDFQQSNDKAFRLQKSVLTSLRTKQTLGDSDNTLKVIFIGFS